MRAPIGAFEQAHPHPADPACSKYLRFLQVIILHARWVLIWMGEPRPDPDPETQDPLWTAYSRIATGMIDHAGPSFSDVDLKVIRMSTESMTPEEANNFGLKAAMAKDKHKRALDAELAEAEQKEAEQKEAEAKFRELHQQRLQLQRLEDAMAQSKKQAGLGEAEAVQFRALDQQLQKLRLQLQQLEGAMTLQDMKQPESEAEALLKLTNLEEAMNMNNKALAPTKKRKKKKKGKKADPASSGVEQQPDQQPEPELDAASLDGEHLDARVVGLGDGPVSTDEEEDIVLAAGGPAHAPGSDDEAALEMQTSVLEATMPQVRVRACALCPPPILAAPRRSTLDSFWRASTIPSCALRLRALTFQDLHPAFLFCAHPHRVASLDTVTTTTAIAAELLCACTQAAAPIDFSQLQPLEDVSWTSSEDDEPEPALDPGLEAVAAAAAAAAAEAAEATAAADATAAVPAPVSDIRCAA